MSIDANVIARLRGLIPEDKTSLIVEEGSLELHDLSIVFPCLIALTFVVVGSLGAFGQLDSSGQSADLAPPYIFVGIALLGAFVLASMLLTVPKDKLIYAAYSEEQLILSTSNFRYWAVIPFSEIDFVRVSDGTHRKAFGVKRKPPIRLHFRQQYFYRGTYRRFTYPVVLKNVGAFARDLAAASKTPLYHQRGIHLIEIPPETSEQ